MTTNPNATVEREISLSVVVTRDNGKDYGYIYMDSEIAFEHSEPSLNTPEGTSDFAGIVVRQFARRLRRFTTND